MDSDRTGQARPQPGGKQGTSGQQAAKADQQTWEGGGREPVDPDDIGADGEFFGKDRPRQALRSDDN